MASTTCTSPLALERLGPAVPFESLCQIHAPFTPVAACPVIRAPDRLLPKVPLASGFDDTLILTTRQRKVLLSLVSLTPTSTGIPYTLAPTLTTETLNLSSLGWFDAYS